VKLRLKRQLLAFVSVSVMKLILFVKAVTVLMGLFVQPHVLRTLKFLPDALLDWKK
jgi:hypothetical protein